MSRQNLLRRDNGQPTDAQEHKQSVSKLAKQLKTINKFDETKAAVRLELRTQKLK